MTNVGHFKFTLILYTKYIHRDRLEWTQNQKLNIEKSFLGRLITLGLH